MTVRFLKFLPVIALLSAAAVSSPVFAQAAPQEPASGLMKTPGTAPSYTPTPQANTLSNPAAKSRRAAAIARSRDMRRRMPHHMSHHMMTPAAAPAEMTK